MLRRSRWLSLQHHAGPRQAAAEAAAQKAAEEANRQKEAEKRHSQTGWDDGRSRN